MYAYPTNATEELGLVMTKLEGGTVDNAALAQAAWVLGGFGQGQLLANGQGVDHQVRLHLTHSPDDVKAMLTLPAIDWSKVLPLVLQLLQLWQTGG